MKTRTNDSVDIDFIVKVDNKYYKAKKSIMSCRNCDLGKYDITNCFKYCHTIEQTTDNNHVIFKEINKENL